MKTQCAMRLVCLTLFLFAVVFPGSAPAQTNFYWSTPVASLLDGGSPQGMAVDAAGTFYIADANKHVILKVAGAGTNWAVTTVAGLAGVSGSDDGTNSDARFLSPGGVAVDSAGNLYVADSGNNAIREVTLSGTNWVVATIAGVANPTFSGSNDGTNSDAQFAFPQGIVVDNAGNLFVSDNGATIRKIRHSGTNWIVTTIAGTAGNGGYFDGTNGDAQFFFPFGVAVDAVGNIYVADGGNDTVRKITPSGTNWIVSTIGGQGQNGGNADGPFGESQFSFPVGVAVDTDGNVFVADQNNSTIREISPSGGDWNTVTIGGLAGSTGSTDGTNVIAAFNAPSGVAVDAAGDVFVTDSGNDNVRLGQMFPPRLHIRREGGQMRIFYLFAGGTNLNFTLQCDTNLDTDNWLDVTNDWMLDTNGVTSVTLTPTNQGPETFFRLLQP